MKEQLTEPLSYLTAKPQEDADSEDPSTPPREQAYIFHIL